MSTMWIGVAEAAQLIGVSTKTFLSAAEKIGLKPIVFQSVNGHKWKYLRAVIMRNRKELKNAMGYPKHIVTTPYRRKYGV